MLLGGNPYKFLSEAATQDLMDPATSDEVKDVVDDLEDTLTNNVEEVNPDDMVTNGGIPVTTAENAVLVEANGRYYLAMESVLAICEDEAAETTSEPDGEPTEDEVASEAPNVVEQIAQANGVDSEDITVVINADECAYVCECAINESKCSKGKKKGKSLKKANMLSKAADALKGKVKLAKISKKKGKKK